LAQNNFLQINKRCLITKNGLTIKAKLDENMYQNGIKSSNQELEKINITRNDFHGEWNYIIHPQKIRRLFCAKP